MSKKTMSKAISKDTGLSVGQAKAALDSVLSNIMSMVDSSRKLSLIGFGSFEKVIRKPRICRNPQTGEKIEVGEKATIKFTPSGKFKELLQL